MCACGCHSLISVIFPYFSSNLLAKIWSLTKPKFGDYAVYLVTRIFCLLLSSLKLMVSSTAYPAHTWFLKMQTHVFMLVQQYTCWGIFPISLEILIIILKIFYHLSNYKSFKYIIYMYSCFYHFKKLALLLIYVPKFIIENFDLFSWIKYMIDCNW